MKCPKCLGTGEVQDQRAIGRGLQFRRIKAGLTIYDVSAAMGLSPSYLSCLEIGAKYGIGDCLCLDQFTHR